MVTRHQSLKAITNKRRVIDKVDRNFNNYFGIFGVAAKGFINALKL